MALMYNGGTAARRHGGTAARRHGGTAARRHGGTALLVTFALLALALLLSVQPAAAQNVDYDTDDNRLIEVGSVAQFNAIRHDLTGAGTSTHATYTAAFPTPATGQCPTSCQGYELTTDIDLSGYSNWTPIGPTYSQSFNAIFDGKGHTVSGLTASVSAGTSYAGLFGRLAASGVLRNVGVINPSVTMALDTTRGAGGLVGVIATGGQVNASYVAGGSVTAAGTDVRTGGLVGENHGTIRASYSTAAVRTDGSRNTVSVGGLAGHLAGTITASYAAGPVSASGSSIRVGGLVGRATGASSIADGRWDTTATTRTNAIGLNDSTGTITVSGHATADLQSPTGYSGIYANWNIDTDGVTGADDPWDFGTASQYPALKFDTDGNGTPTAYEFGVQGRPDPNPAPRVQPPARGGGQPYNWRADHPEIYANARTGITASCEVETSGTGDAAVTTSAITFDLAEYTRPVTLALSLWDRTYFRSLQSLGIAMPTLQRDGQTATVEVVTDPARTRFRLDGPYGLNLVLGYADCHTDDS